MPNEASELHQLFTKPSETFVPPVEGQTEELPDDLKNRHIRRLEDKLQREREANIASAARIEALSEAQKLRQDTSIADWEAKARRIYGDKEPENAAASDLLVEAIREATSKVREQTLEEVRSEMRNTQQEEERERSTVNDYIEQVEERFGVDFTSSDAARERQKEFRNLWFQLSPKNADGNVKDYADPFAVFEIYKSRQPNMAQEYAARGMARSQPIENTSTDDATTKYLRENGIIDPF